MRRFILKHLDAIYSIYIFIEMAIAIDLLTMKEFRYQFFFSVFLIILLFTTIYFFTKNVNESQVYYNFLTNQMLFVLSFQSFDGAIKMVSAPIFAVLFFYFIYLKYKDEKNKKAW